MTDEISAVSGTGGILRQFHRQVKGNPEIVEIIKDRAVIIYASDREARIYARIAQATIGFHENVKELHYFNSAFNDTIYDGIFARNSPDEVVIVVDGMRDEGRISNLAKKYARSVSRGDGANNSREKPRIYYLSAVPLDLVEINEGILYASPEKQLYDV